MQTEDNEYLAWIRWLHKVPVWAFCISFSIGTLLLLLYMAGEYELILIAGFLYVLFAAFINSVILLAMVAISFSHRKYQKTLLQNTSLMLLNIPIAIVYFIILTNNY